MRRTGMLLGVFVLLAAGLSFAAKWTASPSPSNAVTYEQLVPSGYVLDELSPAESRIPYWTAIETVDTLDEEMLHYLCRTFLAERPVLDDVTSDDCRRTVLFRSGVERAQELRPDDVVWVPAPENTEAVIQEQIEQRTALLAN